MTTINRRLSPAQRHFIRVSAATAKAADVHGGMATGSAYELMLAKLTQDRARLKQIQSVEQKIEIKRQLVPEYADYIDGVLKGDSGAEDQVVARLMVWSADIGDVDGAMAIGGYLIKHGLGTADAFKRSTGCLLVEELSEHASAALGVDSQAMTLQQLADLSALTASEDMPDEVRAKLEKVTGRTMLLQVNADEPAATDATWLEQALGHFKRALQLHEKCGVKTDIGAIERQLKKIAPAAPAAS